MGTADTASILRKPCATLTARVCRRVRRRINPKAHGEHGRAGGWQTHVIWEGAQHDTVSTGAAPELLCLIQMPLCLIQLPLAQVPHHVHRSRQAHLACSLSTRSTRMCPFGMLRQSTVGTSAGFEPATCRSSLCQREHRAHFAPVLQHTGSNPMSSGALRDGTVCLAGLGCVT